MSYLFGDSELAAKRLEAVARVYRQPTREFLVDAVKTTPSLAVDLGCGLGLTTHLLSETLGSRCTVGLDNAGPDERPEARESARRLGAPLTVVKMGQSEMVAAYPQLIRAAEGPVLDTTCGCIMRLAQTVHRQGYKDALTGEGHSVEIATTAKEGLKMAELSEYDLVMTDLGMPDMSGWEVAKSLRERWPVMPVILVTGWGTALSAEEVENAVTAGVDSGDGGGPSRGRERRDDGEELARDPLVPERSEPGQMTGLHPRGQKIEGGPVQVGEIEVGLFQTGVVEHRVAALGVPQRGVVEVGGPEGGPGEVGLGELGAREVRPVEAHAGEVDSAHVHVRQRLLAAQEVEHLLFAQGAG